MYVKEGVPPNNEYNLRIVIPIYAKKKSKVKKLKISIATAQNSSIKSI